MILKSILDVLQKFSDAKRKKEQAELIDLMIEQLKEIKTKDLPSFKVIELAELQDKIELIYDEY